MIALVYGTIRLNTGDLSTTDFIANDPKLETVATCPSLAASLRTTHVKEIPDLLTSSKGTCRCLFVYPRRLVRDRHHPRRLPRQEYHDPLGPVLLPVPHARLLVRPARSAQSRPRRDQRRHRSRAQLDPRVRHRHRRRRRRRVRRHDGYAMAPVCGTTSRLEQLTIDNADVDEVPFISLTRFKEFGWDSFRKIGADLQIRRMYTRY